MKLLHFFFAAGAALALVLPQTANAGNLSYVVKVNGEPITSYDVSQRQKFLALTSGALGKRMRGLLQSAETKQKFQQFMQQQRPQSRAEAQKLQKEFVNRLQKQVMADINRQTRDEAIEQLIDERLMLQEAKRREVSVSESEVDERLAQMAKANNKDRTVDEFLAAFKKQGVEVDTMRERIRAQLAWRDTIRKLYGFRIASLVGSSGEAAQAAAESARGTVFDVRRLRLAASGGEGAIARAYVRGQSIRKQFSSCSDLSNLAQRAGGAKLERHAGKKAAFFPRDARPLLLQASAGQMLPPLVSSGGVDLYAVCGKKTPEVKNTDDGSSQSRSDRRQQEFQIYARRHLKDLRQDALIERR
ncbi:periplasmic chaperone for outer membrane proteins SurA [Dichotomicrobium thermohalophilum]|uniref:Periplasmic chaperone for outer membrane proteins SurA n=2 Tax=Dichotomicrobium thermohalophilum TaxID=933063 RepID=A0A397Q6A2_9HYPH|nr:periplasmic chaperone for outer membrane proteins SurA [Dichotomicrobium thermohalophilum]